MMLSSKTLHYLSQYVSDTKAVAYYTSNVNIVYNTITSNYTSNLTYTPVYTYDTLYSYVNKTSNLFDSNIKTPYNEIVSVNEREPNEDAATADYFYYSFNDTSVNASNYIIFSSNTICDVLIVGGGGSGATGLGGGSSGGLLYAKGVNIPPGEYPITVGAGGSNGDGGDSSAFGAIAYGGMKATTLSGATNNGDNDISNSIITTYDENKVALAGGTSQYTYQGQVAYAYNNIITATGATAQQVTGDSNYYYYAFTTVGSGNSIVFSNNTICDVLIVGGGGSGNIGKGGGSSGGILYTSNQLIPYGTYPIIVGAGGVNGNGDDSSVFGATAKGGLQATTATGATNNGDNIILQSTIAEWDENKVALAGGTSFIEYTTAIRKYPPTGLIGGTISNMSVIQTPSGTPSYGTGNYYISWSSEYSTTYPPSLLLDGSTGGVGGHWSEVPRDYSNGVYSGSNEINGYKGEWIKIQLPVSIHLSSVKMFLRYVNERGPVDFKIFGSNDAITWIEIINKVGAIYTSQAFQTNETDIVSNANNIAYNHYALVANKLNTSSNDYVLNFTELQIYGFESIYTPSGGGGVGSSSIETTLIQFPRQVMTSSTITYNVNGTSVTVNVKESSRFSTRYGYKLFDGNTGVGNSENVGTTGWTSSTASYAANSGGSLYPSNGTHYAKSDYRGEFIMIDLGEQAIITEMKLWRNINEPISLYEILSGRHPKDYRLYGSNDLDDYNGTTENWTQIFDKIGTGTSVGSNPTYDTFTNTNSFRYYAFVVKRIFITIKEYAEFYELELFGRSSTSNGGEGFPVSIRTANELFAGGGGANGGTRVPEIGYTIGYGGSSSSIIAEDGGDGIVIIRVPAIIQASGNITSNLASGGGGIGSSGETILASSSQTQISGGEGFQVSIRKPYELFAGGGGANGGKRIPAYGAMIGYGGNSSELSGEKGGDGIVIVSVPISKDIGSVYYNNKIVDLPSASISLSHGFLNNPSYYYYAFTDTTKTNYITFNKNTVCDVLIVGGGGSGAIGLGGGSSGGLLYSSNVIIPPGEYPITVGAGGVDGNGGSSTAFGATVYGGMKASTIIGATKYLDNEIIGSLISSVAINKTALGGGNSQNIGLVTYLYSDIITAVGATAQQVSDDINYYYYTFTSTTPGANSITFSKDITCDILLVGGGGAGNIGKGGGSAGAVIYYNNVPISSGTYQITVGNGGQTSGENGTSSTFYNAIAFGGKGAITIDGASSNIGSNVVFNDGTMVINEQAKLGGASYTILADPFFNATANLLAWYKFDGNANDSSGNNKHLTLYNNPTPAYDSTITIDGSSVNIDGDTYLQNSTSGTYFTPSNLSISFWLYGGSQSTTHQAILSARKGSPQGGWIIYILPSTKDISFWVGASPWNSVTVTVDDLFSASWKFFTITYSSTNALKIYKNGVSIYSGSLSTSRREADNFRIGAGVNESTPQFYLNNGSKIDDCRIYNKILSVGEISILYNRPKSVIISGGGGGTNSITGNGIQYTIDNLPNGGSPISLDITGTNINVAGGGGGSSTIDSSIVGLQQGTGTYGYGGNSRFDTFTPGSSGVVIIRTPAIIDAMDYSYQSISSFSYNDFVTSVGAIAQQVIGNPDYYYYAFTTVGYGNSITFSKNVICDILLVGGGGAGNIGKGGGSSGGMLYAINQTIPSGTYPITIGAGGVNGNGGDSVAFGATAKGGLQAIGATGATNNGENVLGEIIATWDENKVALAGGVNAIDEYTAVRVYPPKPIYSKGMSNSLRAKDVTVSTSGITYGSGIYNVDYTSDYGAWIPLNLFTGMSITDAGAHSADGGDSNYGYNNTEPTYSITSGDTLGNALVTSRYIGSDTANYGEWLIIKMPVSIKLSYVRLYARVNLLERAPEKYIIYGSNDGTNWNTLINTSAASYNATTLMHQSETININISYNYFAITITKIFGKANAGYKLYNYTKLEFYGAEYVSSTPSGGGGVVSIGGSPTSSVDTPNGGEGFPVSIRTPNEIFAGGGGANGGVRVPETGYTIGYGGNSSSTTAEDGGSGIVIIRVPAVIQDYVTLTVTTPTGGGGIGSFGESITELTTSETLINGGAGFPVSIRAPNELFAGGGGANGGTRIPASGKIIGYGGSSSDTTAEDGGDGIVIIRFAAEIEEPNLLMPIDKITGSATTILDNDLTPNKVVITDATGKINTSNNITSTELGYISGVQYDIQQHFIDTSNYTENMSSNINSNILATSNAITSNLVNINTYFINTSNNLSSNVNSLNLENINVMGDTRKVIVNNIYDDNLTINAKLTVNSNLNISGTTTEIYAPVFNTEALEINTIISLPNPILQVNYTGTSNILEIYSNTSIKDVVSKDGFLGIGITDPQFRIDASSNINITGNYKINGTDLSYYNMSNVPLTFNPSVHDHLISDIIGLQTQLDNKQDVIPSISSVGDTIIIDADVNLTTGNNYTINGVTISSSGEVVSSTTIQTILPTQYIAPIIEGTSAKIIHETSYQYAAFTNVSATNSIEFLQDTICDILVVGGGGSGAIGLGGGSSGGMLYAINQTIPSGTYPITIGAGGVNGNGGDSSAFGATAKGGLQATSETGATNNGSNVLGEIVAVWDENKVALEGGTAVIIKSAIRKYPPSALTGGTFSGNTITRQPTGTPSYGTGNYTIYWSSTDNTYKGDLSFDGVITSGVGWLSASGKYSSTTGESIDTNSYIGTDTTNHGQFIKLKLPVAIYLTSIKLFMRRYDPFNHRDPKRYVVYGSNDGISWTMLINRTEYDVSYDSYMTESTPDTELTTAYSYIGFTFTLIGISNQDVFRDVGINEIELYGSEAILSISSGGGGVGSVGSSSVCKYPPVGLIATTANKLGESTGTSTHKTLTITSITSEYLAALTPSISYGGGNYTITWSSEIDANSTYQPPHIFNGSTTDVVGGYWGAIPYNGNNYLYNGTNFIKSDYKGEWVKIKLPISIFLSYVKIYPRPYWTKMAPEDFKIYGTNNGTDWNEIISKIGASYGGTEAEPLPYISSSSDIVGTANTTAYNEYALVVSRLLADSYALNFSELEFYGSEDTSTPSGGGEGFPVSIRTPNEIFAGGGGADRGSRVPETGYTIGYGGNSTETTAEDGGDGIVIIRWNTAYNSKTDSWLSLATTTQPIINSYNFYNETSNLLVWYKFDQEPSNGLTLTNYGIGNGTSSTYDAVVTMNGAIGATLTQNNEYYPDTNNYNWSSTMGATSENFISVNNPQQLLNTMMTSDYSISFWKTSYDVSVDYSVYARNDATIPATDNANILVRIHTPWNNNIVYYDNGNFSGTTYNRLQSSAITNYSGVRQLYTFTRKISGTNEILSAYINGNLLTNSTYTAPTVVGTTITPISGTSYVYAVFTTVGSANSIYFPQNTVCDILIVGGGGGGGWSLSGGGGAGSVIHIINENIPSGKYDITIGNGGNGGTSSSSAGKGGNTIISKLGYNIVIAEGGGGGTEGTVGNSGGSGSGTMGGIYSGGAVGTQSTTGIFTGVIYGNKGGNIKSNRVGTPYGGSGGGGAGSPAQNITTSSTNSIDQGNGGDGIQINIDGNNYYWGGGGGGTGHVKKGGDGGKGGGGGGATGGFNYTAQGGGYAINSGENGGNGYGTKGGDGGANTGGGGGASTWTSGGGANPGGNGGSGIVIVRWQVPLSLSQPTVSADAKFYIGLNKNAAFAFKNKSIGDFRIYNRVITTAEMSVLYNIARKTQFASIPKQINNYTSYYEFKTSVGQINTLTKYPREPMTTYNLTYTDGSGVIVRTVASSQDVGPQYIWISFSGTTNDAGWGSGNSRYNSSTGLATTTRRTGYAGEYMMIDLGEEIILNNIKIYPRTSNGCQYRSPKEFKIFASNSSTSFGEGNQNIDWTEIYTGFDSSNGSQLTPYSYIIGNTISYRYYMMVINKIFINGLSNMAQFAELELYGYPTSAFKTTQYPRRPMSGSTITYNFNGSDIIVNTKASSMYTSGSNWPHTRVFDGVKSGNDQVWISGTNPYSNGQYPSNGSYYAKLDYRGEYIMIDLGEQAIITQMKIWRNTVERNFPQRHPRNYRLYGSNNASDFTNVQSENWVQIFDKIDNTAGATPANNPTDDNFTNTISYRYYALVINKVYATTGSEYVEIYELELFSRNSSSAFKTNTITFLKDTVCDVLVVGGGGSGGVRHAGGGGAGACIYMQNYTFPSGRYDIVIGEGGASVPNTTNAIGYHGDDTYIQKDGVDIFRAIGGAGGGYDGTNDIVPGGSSGGAAASTATSEDISTLNFPNGTYGNKGGIGLNNVNAFYAGGGGGGAGDIGGNAVSHSATTGYGGAGGDGRLINITGHDVYYAAGGGGGIGPTGIGGMGGSCIGGNGSVLQATALNGVANTGSGGGGSGFSSGTNLNGVSGAGGSGIVIIRWNNFADNSHINYNDVDIYNNNVVIGKTKYLDNFKQYGDIRKYPPVASSSFTSIGGSFTELSFTITGQFYGNGTYTSSQSSILNGYYNTSYLFNGVFGTDDGIHTAQPTYIATSGVMTASNTMSLGNTNYLGEWIKIKIPSQIYLAYVKIYARSNILSRSPSIYRIYGSNDDINWTLLIDNNKDAIYSNLTNTTTSTLFHTSPIANLKQSDKYIYFALCVNKLKGGDAGSIMLNFSQLEFYGSETFTKVDMISNYDFYNDTSDMKVWYKFDDLTDTSHNGLTLTNSGSTISTVVGNYVTGTGAIQLGTSAFAYVKSPSDNYFSPNTSFTYSFWLKSNNNSANHQAIINSRFNSSSPYYGWDVVRLQNETTIYITLYKSTVTSITKKYEVGSSWNHFVCVLEYVSTTQQNMSLYMNGVFKEVISGNIYDPWVQGELYFGKSATGTAFTVANNTFIDDFRMYNRVLNLDEIEILYDKRKIEDRTIYEMYYDKTNLALQYDFDTTNVLLNKGYLGTSYNLTCVGTLQAESGAVNLNNNSYLSVNTALDTTGWTECSICFRLKRTALNSNGWDIIFNHISGQPFIIQRNTATSTWAISIFGSGQIFTTSTTLNDFTADNIWNHYVFVFNKEGIQVRIKIYKNGVFDTVFTNLSGTWTTGISSITISQNVTTYTLKGLLDDVRIYNRVLTTDEIQTLNDMVYNKVDTYNYNFNGSIDIVSNTSNTMIVPAGNIVAYTGDITTTSGNVNTNNLLINNELLINTSIRDYSSNILTKYPRYALTNNSMTYPAPHDNITVTTETYHDFFYDTTDMLAWYKFSGTKGIDDSSGNSKDATATGTPVLSETSLSITKDNYLKLPDNIIDHTKDICISFWYRFDNVIINYGRLFEFSINNNTANHLNSFKVTRAVKSSSLVFLVGDTQASIDFGHSTSGPLIHLTWVIKKDGTWIIYKNGVQIESVEGAYPSTQTYIHSYLGKSNWASEFGFDNRITLKDLRIYKRALTPDEIMTLYTYSTSTLYTYLAFNNDKTTVGWTINPVSTTNYITDYPGEYLKLDLGEYILPKNIDITPVTAEPAKTPKDFRLYGAQTINGAIVYHNGVLATPSRVVGSTDYYFAFTSTTGANSITFTKDTECDILIVGGGGSGNTGQGGGSSGGMLYATNQPIPYGTYPITIGAGGVNGNGGDSVAFGATAKGGLQATDATGATNNGDNVLGEIVAWDENKVALAGGRQTLSAIPIDDTYSYYAFTTVENNGIVFGSATTCDVLMVGGGGAGGMNCGGGGGAGACIVSIGYTFYPGTYNVTVGKGGAFVDSTTHFDGGDSLIYNNTNTYFKASGGGKGAVNSSASLAHGGCTGGNGGNISDQIAPGNFKFDDNIVNGTIPLTQTSTNYGIFANEGGKSVQFIPNNWNQINGAGGGGIGTNGTNSTLTTCGTGGDGLYEVIINGISYNFKEYFGVNGIQESDGKYYIGAGGGGGGRESPSSSQTQGGKGGGGKGYDGRLPAITENVNIISSATSYGSGGGGGPGDGSVSGNGYQGIVIIRVPTSAVASITADIEATPTPPSGGGGVGSVGGYSDTLLQDVLKYPLVPYTEDSQDITSSSVFDASYQPWKAFDGNKYAITTAFITGGAYYTGSSTEYNGSQSINGYSGEWLKIDLKENIVLKSYKIYSPDPDRLKFGPGDFKIFGSKDNITYFEIDTQTNHTWTANTFKTFEIPYNNKVYRYYTLIVNKIAQTHLGNAYFIITEWELYGYPLETRNGGDGFPVSIRTANELFAGGGGANGGTIVPETGYTIGYGGSSTATTAEDGGDGIVIIRWRGTDEIEDYTLLLDNTETSVTVPSTTVSYPIVATTGYRYFTLVVKDNWEGSLGTSLSELEIYGYEHPILYTKYPREDMTANTHEYTDGSGVTVRVKASSIYRSDFPAYKAFIKEVDPYDNIEVAWLSENLKYSNTDGTYSGTRGRTDYKGEWLTIDLGEEIILNHIKIHPELSSVTRRARIPRNFRIYASNNTSSYDDINDVNWQMIYEGSTVGDGTQNTPYIYYINNNTSYRYYVLIFNTLLVTIYDNGIFVEIAELELYGTPGNYVTSVSSSKWKVASSTTTNELEFSTSTDNGTNWITRSMISATATGGYTNFTGIHHCKANKKELYDNKYIGRIVSTTKKYSSINSVYGNDNIKRNLDKTEWDALPIVELSSKQNDKNVFGVITKVEDDHSKQREYQTGYMKHYYDKEVFDRRLHIAGVGEGGIWVCNYNNGYGSNIESGDYITSSPLLGFGMKQHDDLQHSYTVAKATMDCDFNPKLLPVKVIATSNILVETVDNTPTIFKNVIIDSLNNEVYTSNFDTKCMFELYNIDLSYNIGINNSSNIKYDINSSNIILNNTSNTICNVSFYNINGYNINNNIELYNVNDFVEKIDNTMIIIKNIIIDFYNIDLASNLAINNSSNIQYDINCSNIFFNNTSNTVNTFNEISVSFYNTSNYNIINNIELFNIKSSEKIIDEEHNIYYKVYLKDIEGNYIYTDLLDDNGNIIYEYEYELRYVGDDGEYITKEEYDNGVSSNVRVYKTAFIGCTYHCS